MDRAELDALLRDAVQTAADPTDLGLALIGIGVGLLTPAATGHAADHRFLRSFAASRLLRTGSAHPGDHAKGLHDDPDVPHLRLVPRDPAQPP